MFGVLRFVIQPCSFRMLNRRISNRRISKAKEEEFAGSVFYGL